MVSESEALRARVAELEARVARSEQAQDELAATRRKLQALLSTSTNILWEIGRDGIVRTNEGQGLATIGLLPGQTVGMSVRDMYAESPEVLAAMERGLRGETFSNTLEVGGALFENHYFPRLAEDGSLESLLGVTVVMSRRSEIEVERRRAEEQLQHTQKQESLAVLAGGIAHDFNNLLVGSLGHADLALRLTPQDSELAEHLREIVHSAERSADLCRQLLAYAGRGQFIIDVIDLNRVVSDSVRLIELSIAKTSTLKISLAPKLPPFRGDAIQIAQVVINLMKNASDAAEGKPSTIHLATGIRSIEPEVRRFTFVAPEAKAGEYVFVRIRDEGVGMQPSVLARIFDPFFSTKQTGRGLGLAAVVGIVRGHGGLLEVESEVGVGTTMAVYLPVTEALSEYARRPEPPTAKGQHENATILLVDDETSARRVAHTMLQLAGCHVIEAANGYEATEIYRARGSLISAVMMDLSMPVMGGEAALRALIAIAPNVRVVVVSGYAELDTASNLAGLRPLAFLQKPYRYEQLLEVLETVVPREAPAH